MHEHYQTMATILTLEMGSQFQKGQFLQKWVSLTTLNQLCSPGWPYIPCTRLCLSNAEITGIKNHSIS